MRVPRPEPLCDSRDDEHRDHYALARRFRPTRRPPAPAGGLFVWRAQMPQQGTAPDVVTDAFRPSDAFHVYDTTLRDGAQQEGLALSVADKLAIARHLDDLGVGFIEGGWPGANPKDTEFFRRAQTELDLQHAQLAAFGATRRPGGNAADDPLVAALRESGAPVVTLVAKSYDRHVEL